MYWKLRTEGSLHNRRELQAFSFPTHILDTIQAHFRQFSPNSITFCAKLQVGRSCGVTRRYISVTDATPVFSHTLNGFLQGPWNMMLCRIFAIRTGNNMEFTVGGHQLSTFTPTVLPILACCEQHNVKVEADTASLLSQKVNTHFVRWQTRETRTSQFPSPSEAIPSTYNLLFWGYCFPVRYGWFQMVKLSKIFAPYALYF